MSIKKGLILFDQIVKEIRSNPEKYDVDLLTQLADDTYKRLKTCTKIDKKIITILSDKKYFKNIASINLFVKSIIGISSSKRTRKDVITENAQLLSFYGVGVDQLYPKLPQPQKAAKRKSKSKRELKSIPDMSKTWLRMSLDELLAEFQKYSTPSELKKAAGDLLKGSDRRLRKRERVEDRIIQRIRDRKALFQLGNYF